MVEFYLPIERDPNVCKDEKLARMIEWWKKSNDLIVKVILIIVYNDIN